MWVFPKGYSDWFTLRLQGETHQVRAKSINGVCGADKLKRSSGDCKRERVVAHGAAWEEICSYASFLACASIHAHCSGPVEAPVVTYTLPELRLQCGRRAQGSQALKSCSFTERMVFNSGECFQISLKGFSRILPEGIGAPIQG